MFLTDAINFYSDTPEDQRGARSRLAKALGVTSGAISQWGDVVPEGQAYKIQSITDGKLRVNPDLYRKKIA